MDDDVMANLRHLCDEAIDYLRKVLLDDPADIPEEKVGIALGILGIWRGRGCPPPD